MKTRNTLFFLLPAALLVLFVSSALAGPVHYRIKIDPKDPSGADVEIVAHAETKTVRLAMAAHPEYHDKYFRYVENFSAIGADGRALTVTNPDEGVWQVAGVNGRFTVRYRVTLSPKEREWQQAWKPYLTPTGGLVGDLHMLMYVIGHEKHPALLTLDMPADWKAVSGLEPTNDPRVFGGSVELLLDSPVLVGDVKEWKFTAGGVPHTVAIWSHADAEPVDAGRIVDGIQKLAEQAINTFGKPPYPRYTFLLENGGQAALEHATSVNVGISRDVNEMWDEIAHEYVHVWNLMDVRPRERVGLRPKFAEPTGVLWWSEGATIFFADLLIRRAGLMPDRRTRIQRLESLITRYLSAPGYSTLAAELVSRGDSHPEVLGDEWASTHLQGEVLVNMLDLRIRDATDGKRSVDDVMRSLATKFDSDRGIVNSDIESALNEMCRCEMRGFFDEYIYAPKKVEFDRYLVLVGMRAEIKQTPAVDGQGKPSVDLRIGPVSPDGVLKLRVTNSTSAWARAGIRTGDRLISANEKPIATWPDFRTWLRTLKVGDTVRLSVERSGERRNIEFKLSPFEIPSVSIVEVEGATPKQLRLKNAWINAN